MSKPIRLSYDRNRLVIDCAILEFPEDMEIYTSALIKDGNETKEFYSYFYEMQPDECNNENNDIHLRNRLNNFLNFNKDDICFNINDSKYNSKLELYFTKYEILSDLLYPEKLIGITLKTKRTIKLLDITYIVFNTSEIKYFDILEEYAKSNGFDGITGFNNMCNGNRYLILFDTTNTCIIDDMFDVKEYTNKEFDILEEETKLTTYINKDIDITLFNFSIIDKTYFTAKSFKKVNTIHKFNEDIDRYVTDNIQFRRKPIVKELYVKQQVEIIV